MLGQPVAMLVPRVIGVKLGGTLREGVTATDLVLRVTQVLRKHGVVGKFVEFFGPGMAALSLADRATISNMCPEYGATCAMFPVDAETLRYLRLSGRSDAQVALVEAYMRGAGPLPRRGDARGRATRSASSSISAASSRASPGRAGRRIASRCRTRRRRSRARLPELSKGVAADAAVEIDVDGARATLRHGSVVIAAITSCTNTSNPSVMLAAGLLAKKAVLRGLETPPWVKTSLAPGSQVVDRLPEGSRPAARISSSSASTWSATAARPASATPGRCPRRCRRRSTAASWWWLGALGQPQLRGARAPAGARQLPDVAAAGGRLRARGPHGRRSRDASRSAPAATAQPVYLRDVWPTTREIAEVVERAASARACSARPTPTCSTATRCGARCRCRDGDRFAWEPASTYVRKPPYFDGMPREAPSQVDEIERRARARLARRQRHHRPHLAGRQHRQGDARRSCICSSRASRKRDFNSYGSRRGNHEVMVRGTFANVRLRNRLAPGTEGGVTVHVPERRRRCRSSTRPMRYRQEGVPLRDPRGQGVRLGFEPRLGRQGTRAARRARGDRGELRAHPPLEPGRDGHPAAGVREPARARRRSASPASETLRHRRAARRDRERLREADARSPCACATTTARPPSSRCACASIRRRRSSTTATAASSSTCCGRCWVEGRRASGRDRAFVDLLEETRDSQTSRFSRIGHALVCSGQQPAVNAVGYRQMQGIECPQ